MGYEPWVRWQCIVNGFTKKWAAENPAELERFLVVRVELDRQPLVGGLMVDARPRCDHAALDGGRDLVDAPEHADVAGGPQALELIVRAVAADIRERLAAAS